MDNSNSRLVDVFFYGLYMDETILKSKNVNPRNQRKGVVRGFKLRIGKMATLLRNNNGEAHGLIYSLTHSEIDLLYKGSGLTDYVPEALLVETDDNKTIPALCCNLLTPPRSGEQNREYHEKLIQCMNRYNLPNPENV